MMLGLENLHIIRLFFSNWCANTPTSGEPYYQFNEQVKQVLLEAYCTYDDETWNTTLTGC